MRSMLTAKVKDGVIVAEGVDLPEGETVTVLLDVPGEHADELTPAQEAELVESEAALDRDEGLPWDRLRAELYRE